MVVKVVVIPGGGSCDVETSYWYKSVRDAIVEKLDIKVNMQNMPDAKLARERFWLPFIENVLECDEQTILIGHSSGALAAMRFVETHRVVGMILVSAYASDFGDVEERMSGYFDRPWKWTDIRRNAGFIVQLGSTDDPLVPWEEQEEVANSLRTDFKRFDDKGHFTSATLPEIIEVLRENLLTLSVRS